MGGKGAKQKHGGHGPSQLTRPRKPKSRPTGQCKACYESGLPHAQTRKLCKTCR